MLSKMTNDGQEAEGTSVPLVLLQVPNRAVKRKARRLPRVEVAKSRRHDWLGRQKVSRGLNWFLK